MVSFSQWWAKNGASFQTTFSEHSFENWGGGPLDSLLYMGKMGSICRVACALSASLWGQCPQALVLLAFLGHAQRV